MVPQAVVEITAGVGTFTHAYSAKGVRPHMLSEVAVLKQRVLEFQFPHAHVLTDAFDINFSLPSEKYIHITAGLPCQPFAPHGERRAELDPRSITVSDAPARIAARLGARKIVFVDIEEHADLLKVGRAVLDRLQRQLEALELNIVMSPPELFSPHDYGGPVLRRRVALRAEPACVVSRLGPPPKLRPVLKPSKTIADIWLPDADVRPEQFVPGVLSLLPHVVHPRLPVVVATLQCGGAQPYFCGSVVKLAGDEAEYVIREFESATTVRLMRDAIGEVAYFPGVPVSSIVEHVVKTYDVLGCAGTARSFTKMSVPPLCHAKQLWLRGGRAYSPGWKEMIRLLELDEAVLRPLIDDPTITDAQLAEIIGDMLSMRMAESSADRSVTRAEQYETAIRLDVAVAAGDRTFEARAAQTFQPVAYADPFSVVVVFVAFSARNEMLALGSRDRLQLPCASADAGSGSRASLVDTADRLVKRLDPGLGFAPHTFLVMQQSSLLAVACPLLGCTPDRLSSSYSAWFALSELAGSPIYLPVASAFARTAAYCRHGVPVPDVDVHDGARQAKRVLTLPWTPSATPAAWPLQLQYLTAVDALLRRHLSAVSRAHPHRAYLTEWIDQVDTSLNASIPFCLRGMSQVEFGDKRLLTTPFQSSVVINKTDPPTFPSTPSTTFKPTSVRQILTDDSILKIVRQLGRLVLAMQHIKAGEKIPSKLRAKLKTLVIPQSGFHPRARGITWDLRQRHADGHFMPLDVDLPIDTHLHTRALFDALGESYPDQSLRHQILKGALFFANDEAMQIVICPHLLSIADGFPLMEKTFIRREKLGYLSFTTTEHQIDIEDERVVLALGIVPVRITAQGARARKLTPLNPRGIADAGGPHDFGPDDDGVPVKSLNELIGWRSEVNGVPKFNKENKPTTQQVMNNVAVLKFAGRIFGEPLLLFNDDSADAFNQFHLHRSQIRMTSILWLKITEVLSTCEYTHIIEPTFGYGFSNASDFCQRFNDMLQYLVEDEMSVLEAAEWAKVTDPSQRAWMLARDALTAKTGREQRKLFFMLVFTDDPLFAAVGFERCIRLMCCWRNVIILSGLRMAIAAKRQAGSNVLWIGFRVYGTFGAIVIPEEKRARAIRQLKATAEGAPATMEEAKSIAGLLEHLAPFAAQLRSSMYQMYEPHKLYWSKSSAFVFTPSEQYRIACSRWVDRLVECSGVSCLVVILTRRPDAVGSHLYVMSSDAAKDGTDTPGVGGYMHGRAWCLQLDPSDVAGPHQISINALEFLGIFGNFVHFGPEIPTSNARVLQLSDSLTSTVVCTELSAKAESMQHVHMRLLEEPNYQRLSVITELAHCFGPANIFSDAISRGYHSLVSELSAQLRIEVEWIETDMKVLTVLQELRQLARRDALLDEAKNTRRTLAEGEQARGKRERGNSMGDGPRDARSHGAPSFVHSPTCRLSPSSDAAALTISVCPVVGDGRPAVSGSTYPSHASWEAGPARTPLALTRRPTRSVSSPSYPEAMEMPGPPRFCPNPCGRASQRQSGGTASERYCCIRCLFTDGLEHSLQCSGGSDSASSSLPSSSDSSQSTTASADVLASGPVSYEYQRRMRRQAEQEEIQRVYELQIQRAVRSQDGVCATRGCTRGARFLAMANAYCCRLCFISGGEVHNEACLDPVPLIATPPPAPDQSENKRNTAHPPPAAALFCTPVPPTTPTRFGPARPALDDCAGDSDAPAPVATKRFSFHQPAAASDPPVAPCASVSSDSEREKPLRTLASSVVRGAPSFLESTYLPSVPVAPARDPGTRERRSQSAAPLDEHSEAVFAALASDTSKYALCPGDPGLLRSLIADIKSTVMRGVPASTAKKDRRYWRLWAQHCRLLGTVEWRDDMAANSGLDAVGAYRERLLQSTFVLRSYRMMKPRNRAHSSAKPQSARGPLDAVRRIHKRNDIRMCDAPSVTLLLKGLLDDYVRLHGTESLIPQRREPLTNAQTERLLAPANEGMAVGRRTVSWRQPFWISFAAFLTSLRHTGARKADLLDVTAADFSPSSMTRKNLKWHIGGRLLDVADLDLLSALTRDDCAVIIPGRSKADPFALFFGDKPIYLPFEPDDITNAAMWLRRMELDRPVAVESRGLVPLFSSDDVSVPLTHSEADFVFNSLANALLGADAKSLSLHSGRVWLACALHASKHNPTQIQALVRWLSPEAIKIYAHINPEDYVRSLRRAMHAPITSRLASNIAEIEIDGDRAVQAVRAEIAGVAAAPTTPPRLPRRARSISAPPVSASLSELMDSDGEPDPDDDADADDPSVMCDAGPVVADSALARGSEVAVPLQYGGRTVHYVAALGGRKRNGSFIVRFPDGLTMEARRDRLFQVVRFDERA